MRGQPEQCSAYTTFIGIVQSGQNMEDRVKRHLDIEHDHYLMLIDAQVHLVDNLRSTARFDNRCYCAHLIKLLSDFE